MTEFFSIILSKLNTETTKLGSCLKLNMAEGGTNPSFGGYDDEFVNAVDEELQCVICRLPLREAVQTRCGHRFCKTCLNENMKTQKRFERSLLLTLVQ